VDDVALFLFYLLTGYLAILLFFSVEPFSKFSPNVRIPNLIDVSTFRSNLRRGRFDCPGGFLLSRMIESILEALITCSSPKSAF
jgi:hypothetical protein